MSENKSASERKPYLKKEDVEWAENFLNSTNLGNRFDATEALLIMFDKGEKYKKVKQWLMNLKFDLREISSPGFSDLIKEDNANIDKLVKQSVGAAHLRVQESVKTGSMTFYMFYEKGLGNSEYYLHSQCFGQAIAAIMSMLQFDMSGFQGNQNIQKNMLDKSNKKRS